MSTTDGSNQVPASTHHDANAPNEEPPPVHQHMFGHTAIAATPTLQQMIQTEHQAVDSQQLRARSAATQQPQTQMPEQPAGTIEPAQSTETPQELNNNNNDINNGDIDNGNNNS